MLPIYVISLKASTSRRRAMTGRMADLGLEFSFIDAVNGRDIPEDERGVPGGAGVVGMRFMTKHYSVFKNDGNSLRGPSCPDLP